MILYALGRCLLSGGEKLRAPRCLERGKRGGGQESRGGKTGAKAGTPAMNLFLKNCTLAFCYA